MHYTVSLFCQLSSLIQRYSLERDVKQNVTLKVFLGPQTERMAQGEPLQEDVEREIRVLDGWVSTEQSKS